MTTCWTRILATIGSITLTYCFVCLQHGSSLVHSVKLWQMGSVRIPASDHCFVSERRRYPVFRRLGLFWNCSVEAAEEGIAEAAQVSINSSFCWGMKRRRNYSVWKTKRTRAGRVRLLGYSVDEMTRTHPQNSIVKYVRCQQYCTNYPH